MNMNKIFRMLGVMGAVAMMGAGSAVGSPWGDVTIRPESVKGHCIHFFTQGARLHLPDGSFAPAPEGIGGKVKFAYSEVSKGKNGGRMSYRPINARSAELRDESYSGTGYRTAAPGNTECGTWILTFGVEDSGSAVYRGTLNGEDVFIEDVAFSITPIGKDASAPEWLSRMPAPAEKQEAGAAADSTATAAPVSMAGKAIIIDAPAELEGMEWAATQMLFGRDYLHDGKRVNHMVATRRSAADPWQRQDWVNAFSGETERGCYPGYFDYQAMPDGTAHIQLSGESSDNAWYTLHFTDPTHGTLDYKHEDCGEDDQLVTLGEKQQIPFHVETPEKTAFERGEHPAATGEAPANADGLTLALDSSAAEQSTEAPKDEPDTSWHPASAGGAPQEIALGTPSARYKKCGPHTAAVTVQQGKTTTTYILSFTGENSGTATATTIVPPSFTLTRGVRFRLIRP